MLLAADPFQLRIGHDRDPRSGGPSDFSGIDIDQRCDAKSVVVEAAIVGERHAEVAGSHDDDIAPTIDAQLADEMLLEPRHVGSDTARSEFTEAGSVFSNL